MFDFHKCQIAIHKYKNVKTDTPCFTIDYTKIGQSLAGRTHPHVTDVTHDDRTQEGVFLGNDLTTPNFWNLDV
jgi:hypothetical protein